MSFPRAFLFRAVVGVASLYATGSYELRTYSSDAVRLVRVPNGGIQPEATLDAAGVLHMLYFAGEPRAGTSSTSGRRTLESRSAAPSG